MVVDVQPTAAVALRVEVGGGSRANIS